MQASYEKWRAVGGACRLSRRKSAFRGASLLERASRGGSQLKRTGLAGERRHGPGFSRVQFDLHTKDAAARTQPAYVWIYRTTSGAGLSSYRDGDKLRNTLARAVASSALPLSRAYGSLL